MSSKRFIGFPLSFQILGMNEIKSPLPQRVGQARVDVFIQEQFQFHRSPLLPCWRRLNLALPVFDIARLFQVRIDLVLMVKVISQSGMNLGRGSDDEGCRESHRCSCRADNIRRCSLR